MFLSSAVGSAEGFCLSEPVPRLLSFEGLITEAVEGAFEARGVSLETLPPAVLEVDEVVDADVAAAFEDVGEEDEPATKTEGDLIDEERAEVEPLGGKLLAFVEVPEEEVVSDLTAEGEAGSVGRAVPLVIAFVSEEVEDAAVLLVPFALPTDEPLLLPLGGAVPASEEAAASPLLFLKG